MITKQLNPIVKNTVDAAKSVASRNYSPPTTKNAQGLTAQQMVNIVPKASAPAVGTANNAPDLAPKVNPNADINSVQNKALGNIANTPAPEDKQTIYERNLSQSQDLVTSIANQFNSMISDQIQTNTSNEQQTNAENAARGLMGSPDAFKASSDTTKAGERAMNDINQQKQAAIAQALHEVQTRSDTEYQNEQTLYNNAQTNVINSQATIDANKRSNQEAALKNVDALASSGKTGAQIKEYDYATYQNLMDQTGMTDYQLQNYIDNNPNNPNKPTVKEVPMPGADGKSTIIRRITFDPQTGKSSESDWTIPIPFQTYSGAATTTTTDGKIFQQQPDGTYKDITPDISAATTTNQKDYEYYTKQEKAAGRTPQSFDQWTLNKNAPAAVKEYNAAVAAGFKGTILDYQQQKKGGNQILDADTVNYLAQQYLQTGTMPAMGMGAANIRTQILTTAAHMAGDPTSQYYGQSAALNKAAYDANKSTLTDLTKRKAVSESLENTANRQLDLALTYSDKVPRIDSNFISSIFQHVDNQVWSDPKLTAFQNVILTTLNEYAKVMTGQTTGAAVSDSARNEAQKLLSSNMSTDTFKEAVNLMKQEMQNRLSGWNDEISQTKINIGSLNAGTTPVTTPPSPSTPINYNKYAGGNSGSTNSGSWQDDL